MSFPAGDVFLLSEEEINLGITKEIPVGQGVEFELDGKQNIVVQGVVNSRVSVSVTKSKTLNLASGESERVDFDGDGEEDLIVRLDSIYNGRPQIYLKGIRDNVLVSNESLADDGKKNIVDDGKLKRILIILVSILVVILIIAVFYFKMRMRDANSEQTKQ